MTIVSTAYGLGRHINDPFFAVGNRLLISSKYGVISEPICQIGLFLAKLSIGATLFRVGLGRTFASIVIVALAINFAGNLLAVVSETANCTPTAKNWNPSLPGSCWPRKENEISGYTSTGSSLARSFSVALV